ncbi:tyrosine-type recombinase/integrase [Geomonas sp. Red69]|uniref:tyrosine-type recombinase/integrase n=1 Tax=Geomonas diazotrophica TaxID=2843197 RepID=UPI001C123B49|nr:tyrosine-type recombinase/integrase [Geomonas diazotrophica]MBU5635504.1 tyrosine-type recombinase/integrase [Geomonas diazotrophica]
MPKINLTLREIRQIVPPESGRVDYFDTELRGFLLRVSADFPDKGGVKQKGARVFYVQADVMDPAKGKYVTRKAKVGAFGELTPDEARGKARVLLQQLRAGQPVAPSNVPTLAKMLEIHLADKNFKPRTEDSYRSEIPVKFATWMDLPLTEVSKIPADVIIDRFKLVEKAHGKMSAKNNFSKLQAILNYAKVKYPAAMPVNPCSVIGIAGLWPKTASRDDCLRGNDFKVFREGIKSFNEITQDCYVFCLYHGLRNREAAGLRWEHVDLEETTLVLPDTKSNQPLKVPLSRQSLEILKRRRAENPEDNPFIFPSLNANHASKTGHIALKADLLQYKTGLKLTVHGLRRSFTTIGERLKLRRQDIDKLTNHSDGSVTGKHYDCTDVDDLRAPLQAIANEIERLMVHGVCGKVVELVTRAVG